MDRSNNVRRVEARFLRNSGEDVSKTDWSRAHLKRTICADITLVSEFIEKKGMLSGIPIDLQTHLLKDFGFDNVHSRMFPMTLLDGTKVGKLGW